MDWEKKFQSIVEETDANLAKVKMTLGKGGSLVDSSSIPTGDSNYWPTKFSPLVRDPIFTENLAPTMSLKPNMVEHSSFISTLSPLPHPVSLADSYSQGTSLSAKVLEERLERQNKAIERLSKVVERLESERDQYRDHIRELQHQVRHVNSRLSDSSLESANDRRLELWKREVMTELDSIHKQLRNHVKAGSGSEFTDSQVLQHSRELLELRRLQREDTDSLRKDIDGLKSRITGLELRVPETESQRSRNTCMQSKLDRSNDVSCYHGHKSLGQMEMTELRTNVLCLKHKVDAMEMLILSNGTGDSRKENKYEGSRKRQQARLPVAELLSDDDSLDLADYHDSSDLSLAPKHKPSQDTLVHDSDEELDLNDLDLSDDKDDLSDDDLLTVDDI
ncbi:uncharacterized protein LOC135470733 [Liolophura sinensis]|uniref:uncharacterized protein LOC135470733 n=1 Tax=Liolophura sinensis TaxID=3198878 RepID=UPI0031586CCB